MAEFVVKCYTGLSRSRSMRNKILILLMIATLLATNLGVQSGCRAGSSHLRLYFASEDIPGLRALKDAPSHQAIWNNIKDWADPRVNDEPPGEMLDQSWNYRYYMTEYIRFYVENMAFMYYMTDNTTYLNASKRWLLSLLDWSDWGEPGYEVQQSPNRMILLTIAHTTAFGYDALYDYLTPEERTNLRNMMIERIGELYQAFITEYAKTPWAWSYPCTALITSGGIGMAGLALEGDWAGADDWIDFATFNAKRGLDTIGRDGETWEGHSYQIVGLDGVMPFLNALRRVTGKDLFADSHLDQVPYRYIFTAYNAYGLQFEDAYWGIGYRGPASYAVDGYITGRPLSFFYLLASEYNNGYSQWFANNYAAQYRMTSYLWKDLNLSPKSPNDLPLTKYFRDTGYVIWRTGWGANDLLFAFKSGKGWGHAHPSQNSFGIYYQGKPMTCGVGYWLGAPTWPHNCILVDGEGQVKEDHGILGEILTVEEKSPHYRYLLGDATAPYTGKLDKWLRHVVFMEPNYFIIYDEVAASSPKQFDWLLHAPNLGSGWSEPSLSLSGDLITLIDSGGGELKVKVVEPQGFNYEIIPYYNNQSNQCYYVKVRPSTNQSAAQFLTLFFPDSVLSTNRVAVGNVVGVKVVNGDRLDLILFSQDGNPVNEYIDLGGGYFRVIAGGGGNYSFEDTGIRVQFDQYIVLRLEEVASPVNNSPVLNPTGDKTVIEGELLEFTISAFDPDNDSLTYSANLTSLPPETSFNPATRTFSWTPTSGQAGTYNVHFEITDGELSDSEDITIKVSADPISISFAPPTDADGVSIDRDWTEVNAVVDSIHDSSSLIDWDKSLVGYWDFNEGAGSIAYDKSSYGNHGTLKNGPQWVSGKFGNALEFDGVDDYVEIPNSGSLNITDAITIEVWAKPAKVGDPDHYHYLVSKSPGYKLFIREDLVTYFYLSGVYDWGCLTQNVPDYFDGNWHHLVGTYDKNGGLYKMKIYIDGVLYTGVVANGSIGTSGNPLTIGCKYSPWGSEYSVGLIDEVRIWNRALSEQEIKASYNARIHNSYRKFTDLADGTYQYYAYATYLQGNSAQTETRTLTVNATLTNQAPVLDTIGDKSVDEGQLLQFTTSASDPDGDPLTYSASYLPSGASFNPATRTFSWTPTSGQAGTYPNLHFEVSDGELADSEDITITVNAPTPTGGSGGGGYIPPSNSPPVLDTIGDKLVGEGELLEFTISATDSNGDLLTSSASNLPPGASFDPETQTFSWTPSPGEAGTYPNVHFEVFDGKVTASEDITITVLANNCPVLDAIGDKSATERELLEFTISATDPDGDSLTYSASNLPLGASFDPETQTFSWTPSPGQAGSYPNVHFEVSDAISTNFEDVTITVQIADETPPEVYEVVAYANTTDSAEICWTTDEPSTSQVKYWASPSKVTPLDEALVTHHMVRINGLTPGTTYYYNTISRDEKGNLTASPQHTFSTPTKAVAFTVSELDITPAEAHISEDINISVLVTNNGDTAMNCEVVLSSDDATEATEQIVDMSAGVSQRVSFTVIRQAGCTFTINVNSIEDSIVVEEVTGAEPESGLLRVNPDLEIETGKLTSARISYQFNEPYESMSEVELILQVNLDDNPLETVPILLPSELRTEGIVGSLDYVPSQGWSSGVYTFQAQLYEGERLLDSTNIGKLEVTSEFLVGFVVREVQWATLGMIMGGALVVISLIVFIILHRRRDMFRNHTL